MSSHLDLLNPAQRDAVAHTEGPLLVLAGAGAGKTRVIAHRILEIVRQGTSPRQILAITFTNKAAREMQERVATLLSTEPSLEGSTERPFVSTFHSLGLSIIKENYRALGLTRFPAIYDRADSLRTMKTALKEAGLAEELDARLALSVASRQKGEGATAEQFAESAETPRARIIARAWNIYERLLAEESALDFDDLILRAVAFVRSNDRARAAYRARWTHLHIDEYQDTNRMQSDLAGLLVGKEQNICAVGDIDQTIYTWRGADIGNIMTFEKTYPGARIILLEENYRSTKTILAAANDIIAKNIYRVEKNLFTNNGEGEALSLYQALNETDEAAFVARKAATLIARGARPSDIAVLYRANFQSRALEEAFLGVDIPYQVLGTRFFERAEIKDALSYMRAAWYGTTPDIARIANSPRRGIGAQTLLALLQNRDEALSSGARQKITTFRALLKRIAAVARVQVPSALVAYVVRETGMEAFYKADHVEGQERLENLRELVALASRYNALPLGEGLEKMLEDAALQSDQDELTEERDAVRLMTVHASKGLEFPYVFITGLEEGLFPYSREHDKPEDGEEERRLMYVALTRAKKKVFLSCASMRTIFGSQSFTEPSQFIADISNELVEWEAPNPHTKSVIQF